MLSYPNGTVTGTWGQASQPMLLTSFGVVALDYGNQIGLGIGDVLFVQFNQPVAQVRIGTRV